MHSKLDYNFYLNQDTFDTLQEISNKAEIKSIFLKAFSSRHEFISDSLQQEQSLNSKLTNEITNLTHQIEKVNALRTNALEELKSQKRKISSKRRQNS